MGGSHFSGNMTPMAEFNFHSDPEAAKIVLESSNFCTLFPLEVAEIACISSKLCQDYLTSEDVFL